MTAGIASDKKTIPLKKFGQNFLTSPAVAERIVNSAGLTPDDTVLEIGPGKGVLTSLMAERCRKVWAVEIDARLAENLNAIFGQSGKIKIVNHDILQYNLDGIIGDAHGLFKVVANLPYNITVPILEKLYRHLEHVGSMVVMVQKEMADRLAAGPGTRDYGSLSVFMQFYAKIEKLFNVSPGSFFPKPKVTSSVIRLNPNRKPPAFLDDENAFFDFVRRCFSQRRKMLRAVLRQQKKWPEDMLARLSLEIDLTRRAETMELKEFVKLYNYLKAEQ